MSLGAGNTGRAFDLETNKRIAEFKFIRWQGGPEAIRQNALFKDFYFMAEHAGVKRKYLYVHDAHRQDPHLPMRYDTGRPRAVIRLRISQPRTTSLPLPGWAPGAKAIADDGLVAEERVLHPALTMVPGRLLPLAPAERLHQRDRPIPLLPESTGSIQGLSVKVRPPSP